MDGTGSLSFAIGAYMQLAELNISAACHKVTVACPTLQYFSTLSLELARFPREKLLNTKVCFGSLYKLSETFLILRRIRRDIIDVHTSSCTQVPTFLVRF